MKRESVSFAEPGHLLKILDLEFKDIDLLEKALTHKSCKNEIDKIDYDNERLEFLGDAILDLVISEYLFFKFRTLGEGDLTRVRSEIVNEGSLSEVARKISLGKFIRLGRSELLSNGMDKNSILSDTLEALIAAVYIDSGYSTARRFILRFFKDQIAKALDERINSNFKGRLQEMLGNKVAQIRYLLDKDPRKGESEKFQVKVMIADKEYGHGEGSNIKTAQQLAAKMAIIRLETED